MIDLLRAALALALPAVPACLGILCLDTRGLLGRPERLALAYGLGLGALTWWMTLLCVVRIPLSRVVMAASLLAFGLTSVIALILSRRRGASKASVAGPAAVPEAPPTDSTRSMDSARPAGLIDRLLIAGIALPVGRTFLESLLTPLDAYDAMAVWGLKAKALFLSGGFPVDLLRDQSFAWNHPDYPLLVPLAESYIAFALGRFDDVALKLTFPLFFISLLVAFYAALRRLRRREDDRAPMLSRRRALLFTFLLASVPSMSEQAASGYADVAIAFYSGLGTIYACLYLQSGRDIFLTLAALLAGLGATAKNEGILLALIVLGIVALRERGRFIAVSRFAGVLALAVLPWTVARARLGLSSDLVNPATIGSALSWTRLERLGPILGGMIFEASKLKTWNLVWALLAALLALRIGRVGWRAVTVPLVALGLALAGYVAIFLMTPYDLTWHMERSVDRLLFQLLPITLFALTGLHREEQP